MRVMKPLYPAILVRRSAPVSRVGEQLDTSGRGFDGRRMLVRP